MAGTIYITGDKHGTMLPLFGLASNNDLQQEDVLIITGELDENLFLAARNLHKVDVRDATGIDPVSLIAFDKVVMTADAVKQVEEMLA